MFLQCIDPYKKSDGLVVVLWLNVHQQDTFGIDELFGFQLFSLLKQYSDPWADFSTPCLLDLSRQIFIFASASDIWYDILVLHYWEDFQLVLHTANLILSLPSARLLPCKLHNLAGAATSVSSWGFSQMHLDWQIPSCGYSFCIVEFWKPSVTLNRSQISELLCFLLANFSAVTSW